MRTFEYPTEGASAQLCSLQCHISTQLHRALGDSPTYLNYTIFESAQAWRAAFKQPEFREIAKAHPASAVFRPHLFQKVAVENLCTA